MKKGLIFFIYLFIILILSLFLISAFSFSDFLNKITGKVILTCTDSDNSQDYSKFQGVSIGGSDKYVKGNTFWEDSNAIDGCVKINTNAQVVSCQNSDATRCGVEEYYCYSGGMGATYIDCPNGCSEGVCLKEPVEPQPTEETCVDSDGGKNYYVKSSATSFDGYGSPVAKIEDKCYLRYSTGEGSNVNSCSGKYCAVEEAVCVGSDVMIFSPDGEGTICQYGCRDGACCLNNNCEVSEIGNIINTSLTNEINITIFENGEYSVYPETINLNASQKVNFKIFSGNINISPDFSFFPKYFYDTSQGSIGLDGQVKVIKLCTDSACSGEIQVEFIIPNIWVGEYYLELRNEDLTKRFYHKFEVQNDFIKIDFGVCMPLVENSGLDNKLDIVFIADNYNESTLINFSSKVNDFIYDGLLISEPLKSRFKNINFYRIDRVGSLIPPKSESFPGPEFWTEMVSQCPAYDLVIVVQKNFESTPLAFSGEIPPWILIDASQSSSVVVHEFGHAFANLGDEYQNMGIIVGEEDWAFDRANIDKAGCPKWCSGNLNQSAVLVSDDSTFDCYNAYQNFLDCLKLNEPEFCWNNVSQIEGPNEETGSLGTFVGISECNFGISCREDLGCYWNAKAVNTFRPSRTSIMRGCVLGIEGSCQFNLVSQEAILKKLDEFEKGRTNLVCDGCPLENKCYPLGYRKSGNYCSDMVQFVEQLKEERSCDNNFEGSSNVWVDNQCGSGMLFQQFFDWFKQLFGR